jgi:hypothetical protein
VKFNHFWHRKILWKAHRKYLCKKYSTLFSKKIYGMEYKKTTLEMVAVTVWDIFIRIRKIVKFWTESSWFPRFFDFSVLYYMNIVNIYICSVMINGNYIIWVVYHYSTTKFADKLQRLHLKPHLEGGHLEWETSVTS